MVDSRFFTNRGPIALSRIAEVTGLRLPEGTEDRPVRDVAPLDRATAEHISFFDNVKYIDQFTSSSAGICFVRSKYADRAPANMLCLITEDPYRCYALTAQQFYPLAHSTGGRHPSAIVHPSATLGKNVSLDAGVVIEENVEIGDNASIGANAVIGRGVVIGANTHIGALCGLSHCYIGDNVIIHRGVHIGQDGFGFAMGREGHVKVPQLGRVMIEDEVEIGAGTTIDRGTGPDTIIGSGTKIDNLVQIGHNVHIGRRAVVVAQSGISGSTRIGDGAVLAGQAGIAGHLRIGAGARIAAQAGVMTDIPPGKAYGGSPAMPIQDWHRQTVMLSKLNKKKRGSE